MPVNSLNESQKRAILFGFVDAPSNRLAPPASGFVSAWSWSETQAFWWIAPKQSRDSTLARLAGGISAQE
jgi:hypothetical protein